MQATLRGNMNGMRVRREDGTVVTISGPSKSMTYNGKHHAGGLRAITQDGRTCTIRLGERLRLAGRRPKKPQRTAHGRTNARFHQAYNHR